MARPKPLSNSWFRCHSCARQEFRGHRAGRCSVCGGDLERIIPAPGEPPPPAPGPDDPLETPFVIVVDSREQAPFTFEGLRADARQGRRPLLVRTEVRGLPSGDYSLVGHEEHIAVERKSIADLFGTLGQGRERFQRELERLAQMPYAAIVVEAGWVEVLGSPPPHSQLLPKTIHRSVIAWQQRYPSVHWWPAGDRRLAEITTFRILERYWKEQQHAATKAPAEGIDTDSIRDW